MLSPNHGVPTGPDSLCIHHLRRCAVLRGLSPREVARLAEFALYDEYQRGEPIIHPGKETSYVFIVSAGEVRLYRQASNGREITALVLSVGDIFGAIFTPGTPASAVSRSTLYRLPRPEVDRAIAAHPDLAGVLPLFLQQQRALLDVLEDVALHDAQSQLARLLLQRDANAPGDMVMDTHEEMARRIGARQEHTSRILAHFRREGLIRSQPHRRGITVVNREGLRGYVD